MSQKATENWTEGVRLSRTCEASTGHALTQVTQCSGQGQSQWLPWSQGSCVPCGFQYCVLNAKHWRHDILYPLFHRFPLTTAPFRSRASPIFVDKGNIEA